MPLIPLRKAPAWKVPTDTDGMFSVLPVSEYRWELYLGIVEGMQAVIPDELTANNTAALFSITIVQGISSAGHGGYWGDFSPLWCWQ